MVSRDSAQTDLGNSDRNVFDSVQSDTARLDVSHLPQLEALYAHGGGDAFRQRSLELGVFYGVFDKDRLVSVAGTHIVSDHERIAALGNVMTHPDYRSQGWATVTTRAVCEELLDRGSEMIGLSVGRSNVAAQRLYEKIGFKRRGPFFEGTATRQIRRFFAMNCFAFFDFAARNAASLRMLAMTHV